MSAIDKVHIPSDIVREIISHIDPNDTNALYSCLLINHVWCEHIIPLLWKNPFNLIEKNSRKLVSTLFNFLDERTRSIMAAQNHKKVLIKYPTYFRQVSLMNIYDGVLDWVRFHNHNKIQERSEEFPSKEDQVFSIMISKEILRMILNSSSELEDLKIDVTRELKRRTRCESITFPSLNDDHRINLKRLNTFQCSNDKANDEIIRSLVRSTASIKNFIIFENDCWNESSTAINELIKVQQGVERVIINGVSKGITEIILSSCSQKDSLKEIQFDHVSFVKDEHALKHLSGFENLTKLGFKNCYNFTKNVMKPLLNNQFTKLNSLEINNRNYLLSPDIYPTKEILELIKNLGKNLTELIVNTSYQPSLFDTIFHHIQKYCNNLTTLGLDIGYQQFLPLLELFKSLPKLQRFIVQSDGGSINVDNWTRKLVESMPSSVTSLEVNGWTISPEGLRGFLNFTKNKINLIAWRLPPGFEFENYSNIIDDYNRDVYFVQISQMKQKDQIWDEVLVEFM